MRLASILAVSAAAFLAQPASAQLEQYKDYDVAEAPMIVTTVKVKANMLDYYLQGLKETWVAGNEISKELGQIEGYSIFVSDLPASGDFNLVLVVNFKNTADIGPSKEKYEAFMQKWGEKRQKQSRATAKTYPDMREITGDYLMREITFPSADASE